MTAPPRPPLCVGLSLATTWLAGHGWRQADSRVEHIHEIAFYTDIARRAEAACVDFLFRPDVLFLDPRALQRSPGFSSLDPTVLLSAIAPATQRIGLVTTAATTFNPPYVVARQLQSLDWISQGRAGWNIVTALDGSQNFGDAPMPSSQARYRKAREFVDVVQQLWQSFPRSALRVDRAQGVYADTRQIRSIAHRGEHFTVQGPLNLPARSPDRLPFFQAGASVWGRDFAAGVADAVFAATPAVDQARSLRMDLQARAVVQGRAPQAVRVLPGLSLYLARTSAEARALFAQSQAGLPSRTRRALLQRWLGLDATDLALDAPVSADLLPAPDPGASAAVVALRRFVEREAPTLHELLARPELDAVSHWTVVGTPDEATREIAAWHAAGALDGFIALPAGAAESMDLFLTELMPRLAALGLCRHRYTGSTLAEHLGLQPG